MSDQVPNPTPPTRSSRIIRSRHGATTAAGWLSASSGISGANNPPTSEPSSPEISEHVYLEVIHEESSSKTYLLKCLRKAAMMSTLLADMLNANDILSGRTENGCTVLPLSNPYCSPEAIERIIAYCEYHCDDPVTDPPPGGNSNYRSFEELDEEREHEAKFEIACYWDRSFIASIIGPALTVETRAQLYDLLIGAHYLGIDRLVELGAKALCKQISGKSCEEVRSLLNIANDLDPVEERKIHEENAWANCPSAAQAKTTTATKKK